MRPLHRLSMYCINSLTSYTVIQTQIWPVTRGIENFHCSMLGLHGGHWLPHVLRPWCRTSQIQFSKRALHSFANLSSRSGPSIRHAPKLGITYPRATSTSLRSAHLVSMSGDTSETSDSYRLPTNVKPTHYEVTIRTDLEKLVFDGFVRVQ